MNDGVFFAAIGKEESEAISVAAQVHTEQML